jgi:signal transduction histidine kinase/CheY-like chemotaxis protein
MKIAQLLKNFRKRWAESFTSKIYLTLIGSIVFISFSFTAFFIYYQKRSRTEILINKGELLAEQLAGDARIGVFAENKDLLVDPLLSVMRQPEVLKAKIFTANGRSLIERQKSEVLAKRRSENRNSGEEQSIIGQLRKSCKPLCRFRDKTIDFWTPVRYEMNYTPSETLFYSDTPRQNTIRTIGFVRLTLDKKQLMQSFQAILVNSILITTVILILVIIVAYFITKSIIRPLNRLKEGVYALGTGASVEKVAVESDDEVGKLAAAFNTMAESLKIREMEKEQLGEQLLQAQKMEAVGTLAGGIAHDFNNILTAIIGYGNLLQDELPELDPFNGYVAEINKAASRAATLTQRLLAFSRKQVINPKVLNLNSSIFGIVELLLRLINEDVEFKIQLAEEDLFVKVDEGQIEQVLINLVTNARDAMPNGGELSISTTSIELDDNFCRTDKKFKPGKYARLTVMDSGTGIDAETKDRVFDPFFTTKDVGKGTGLGLSIAYGIIAHHNGYIEVDSEPGKWTSFTIYLPLIASPGEEVRLESLPLPMGNNETVLLAEDDFAARVLAKHLLSKYGYNVIEAVDGEDAVIKFHENKDSIRLLLLDVIMPKKNGKQVYDEIRTIWPDIKTLFISGYTYDIINRENILEQGLNFVSKPLQPYEFLRRIKEVVSPTSIKEQAISDFMEEVDLS